MKSGHRSLPGLYTAAACRELDRLAVEQHGIPGFELMLRAGQATFEALLARWPEVRRLDICCGKGNNAGDGYVVAGLAREMGLAVTLWQIGDPAELQGAAGQARDWAAARGVTVTPGPPTDLHGDVVVDALLGTGMRGELRKPFAATTAVINSAGRPVVAVDIPTGVDADTGAAAAGAVRAELTITFIGPKLGLFTGPGVSLAGEVLFRDLGVPSGLYRALPGSPWLRYPALPARYRLPPRDANTHKHALGHVVVVGGDHNMGGAVLMAAEAALRAGAGMVSVITRAEHRPAMLARRPEVMVAGADDVGLCRTLLEKAACLVVGPGLGQEAWGQRLLEESLAMARPTVLDADGLNGLARLGMAAAGPLVVTPHAGEAARLLGISSTAVQNNRPEAARALAVRVGGVAVLKGAGTVIAAASPGAPGTAELLGICGHGNPGMASAGMGDVLSGVIGGLLAQGLPPAAAAVAGTCLHGCAADEAAAELGLRSLLATDLMTPIIRILADEERSRS